MRYILESKQRLVIVGSIYVLIQIAVSPLPAQAMVLSDTVWHAPSEWVQTGMLIPANYFGEDFLYLAKKITTLDTSIRTAHNENESRHVSEFGFCTNGNPLSVCFEQTSTHIKECTALYNTTFDWDWSSAFTVTLECRGDANVTNGGWTEWSEWSTCTPTYVGDAGTQTRSRSCTNPTPMGGGSSCVGSAEETQACTVDWNGVPPTTVICTELHRQGLLPDEIMTADAQFGAKMPQVVMNGYHLWAKPLVSLMQKSDTVTLFVNYFAQPWAQEMAYQEGVYEHGSYLGKLLMVIGIPVSALLGVVSALL